MKKMTNKEWNLYQEWCNDETTTLEFEEWKSERQPMNVSKLFNLLKTYNQAIRSGMIREAENIEYRINEVVIDRTLEGFVSEIWNEKCSKYILSDKQLWCVAFAMQRVNTNTIMK